MLVITGLGLSQEELKLQGAAGLELIGFKILKNLFVTFDRCFFDFPIGMYDQLYPRKILRIDHHQYLVVVKNSFEVLRNSFCHDEFSV